MMIAGKTAAEIAGAKYTHLGMSTANRTVYLSHETTEKFVAVYKS